MKVCHCLAQAVPRPPVSHLTASAKQWHTVYTISTIIRANQNPPFLNGGVTLENPKAVGRFYLGAIALVLVFAMVSSICLGNFSPFLWALGIIAVMLVACVLMSLGFVIVFAPLLWLLSRLSGRGEIEDRRKNKSRINEK
jgi:hypothetical protein